MSKVKSLPMHENVKIAGTLDITVREVPTVGFVLSKAFLLDVGYQGSVVYKRETVIADINSQETVLLIKNFFSFRCEQTEHETLLAFGPSYSPLPKEDGSQARDFCSGFIKVKAELDSEPLFFPLDCIKRKVTLYNCGNGVISVADYQREARQLSFTIIVPVYIECADMLSIQGELFHESWFGHVQNVDHFQKTVDSFCFVESNRHRNLFERKTRGRCKGGMVETLFHEILSLELQSEEWVSYTCWRKNE